MLIVFVEGKELPNFFGEFPRTTSGILFQEKKHSVKHRKSRPEENNTQRAAVQIKYIQPRTPNRFHHMGLSENVGLIFPIIASHLKTG